MLPDRIVTSQRMTNGPEHGHPRFTVLWERDAESESQLAYTGTGNVWVGGGTKVMPSWYDEKPDPEWKGWSAALTLTVPAYHVFLGIELGSHGGWASFEFPPVIDIATFWWASTLMLESLRRHSEWRDP